MTSDADFDRFDNDDPIRRLLAAIADLLRLDDERSLDHARRLLICAGSALLHPMDRFDISELGIGEIKSQRSHAIEYRSRLDPTTPGLQALVAAAPDLANAVTRYSNDAIVALLHLARIRATCEFEHAVGVARTTRRLAVHMGWQSEVADAAAAAGLFHDLGRILTLAGTSRPSGDGSSGDDECGGYAALSRRLLIACDVPPAIWTAVGHHHEHHDGSGHPLRIAGDNISPGGRLIAVADAIQGHAGIDPRHRAMTPAEKAASLLAAAGNRFDRSLATVAAAMIMGDAGWR